jgi:general secretion pathway protein G
MSDSLIRSVAIPSFVSRTVPIYCRLRESDNGNQIPLRISPSLFTPIVSIAPGVLNYPRIMATQERAENTCVQCGAKLPPELRYCLHCYAPVAGAARAHVKLASQINTTHRVDPMLVFSQEKHDEIIRRARSRKRVIISAATALVIVAASAISLSLLARHRLQVARASAREEAAWRDLNTLAESLERFKGDVNRYPTNEEGLMGLSRRPAAFPPDDAEHSYYWFGPYLDHVPEVDPWGNDYVYRTEDSGHSFELYSSGPGGETGSDSRFRVTSTTATMSDR